MNVSSSESLSSLSKSSPPRQQPPRQQQQRQRFKTLRTLGRIAAALATVFTTTILAPALHAAALPDREAIGIGHVRALSRAEKRNIRGAIGHTVSISPESGSTYSWEGDYNNTNTGNGNKLTDVPITGWSARGALPLALTLYHNSQSSHNSELGNKWTHSLDLYIMPDPMLGDPVVHWGNDLAIKYTQDINGNLSAPTGIYDTLVYSSANNQYTLTTKSQLQYTFVPIGSAGAYYCSQIQDRNGNTVTVNHDSGGFVTSVVDPSGRTLSFSYTSGKISSVTDPAGRVFSFAYNSATNDLSTVTFPAPVSGGSQPTLQFGYDTDHDITSQTDPRGKVWTFGYVGTSSARSLAWQKNPLLQQTSYSYTSTNTTITDPRGYSIVHTYSAGKLTSVKDQANYTESYSYNSSNQKTQVTDRRGKIWQYTYDAKGNVLTAKNPLNQTTTSTYNSFNDPLSVTVPSGRKVENSYNSYGNLVQTQQKSAGGTVMSTTVLTVNSYGQVTGKTDSNSHATGYGYNTNGDLITVTTPSGKVTTFAYNSLGVRTSRKDALSRTTLYVLDNLMRVTKNDYPVGTDSTFVYDAAGNLTSFTDATGTTSRTYDNAGRLLTDGKSGAVVTYTYDAAGNIASVKDPSLRTVTYSYTNRGQISSVTDGTSVTSYGYDANGSETSVTNPNSTSASKAYDDAGRISSINNYQGGSVVSGFVYSYDSDGRKGSVTEIDGSVVSWSYDGAGRLTGEGRTGTNAYSASYTLDGEGNRSSQSIGGVTTSFTYGTDDELQSTSGGMLNSYGYNANGEQTSRTRSNGGGIASTLAYDYDGQLTGITTGTSTVNFKYDALGRRTSRTAGGVTRTFIRSGDANGGQVLIEKQGTSWSTQYTYGNALIRQGSEYLLYDALGSARTITNSSGAVTGSATYGAFGNRVATSGSSTSAYLFAATSGYRDDGDAALMQVGARYYDAEVGRFITRDTVLSEKAYLYCEGDPVNALDPSGHIKFSISLGGTGIGGWLGIQGNVHIDVAYTRDEGLQFGCGIGGGINFGSGFGGSVGVGVGVSGGGISTGVSQGGSTGGFIGDGPGFSGEILHPPHGSIEDITGISGAVGRMGPTWGFGAYKSVTLDYSYRF